MLVGQRHGTLEQGDRLDGASQTGHCGRLRHDAVDHLGRTQDPLGDPEHPVQDLDRRLGLVVEHIGAGGLQGERHLFGSRRGVDSVVYRTEQRHRLVGTEVGREGECLGGHRSQQAGLIADLLVGLGCLGSHLDRPLGVSRPRRRIGSRLQQWRPIRRSLGQLKRLFEQADGNGVRLESGCSCRRLRQGSATTTQQVGAFARGSSLGRRQIVGGHRPHQFHLAQTLEVLRYSQVARVAVVLGEPPVSDLADDALHEAVLPVLGRTPIVLDLEQLLTNQPTQWFGQRVGSVLADNRQAFDGK